ncbi:MAG: hypothetical protein R6X02_01255 [Enhygromyxa sp.]
MGIRGVVRSSVWPAVFAAASLAGCTLDSEPTRMCGTLDLTFEQTRSFEHDAPTVVALSHVDGGGAGRILVVRSCEQPGECEAELVSQSIGPNVIPDQLLLTASGRWLTYRIGPNLFRLDLEAPDPAPIGGPGGVHELVGSLRGGDWLIYRTWGQDAFASDDTPPVHESELWAYYVGEPPLDEDGRPEARPHFRIGQGDFDLRVAAMGHRHVVARRILGNGEEELYLVRIAPARRHDKLGSSSRGKPLLLARGKRFTRVLIQSGPSPAERGDPWEFEHDVPIDVRVIATAGEGPSARTLIYAVADATQIANFEGAVVSSPIPLQDIAGLSPVSPSGTHLAYITPRGSLALRDLESQDACMVRPATAARHVLAGFAADATLYFESLERGRSQINGAVGPNAEIVYAYDPKTEELTALTDDRHTWRLNAVPPRRYETEDGRLIPWAVVAIDGYYAARPHTRPQPLFYDSVSFLPRGDESLWLIEGEKGRSFDEPNRLTVRRVQPGISGDDDLLGFDIEAADPTVLDNGVLRDRFTRTYSGKASVCVSTSQSASRTTPWATSCSTPERPTGYLNSGLPQGEQRD